MKRYRIYHLILVFAGIIASPSLVAQSFPTHFEANSFDSTHMTTSFSGGVNIEGSTGAASMEIPLGIGIGNRHLHFTPTVRLRSTAQNWFKKYASNPNPTGTPPYCIDPIGDDDVQDPYSLNNQAVVEGMRRDMTASFSDGGSATISPGSLNLVLTGSMNANLVGSVTYPDGSHSIVGGATSIGDSPTGFRPAGIVPSGVGDASLALNRFHHGPSDGWNVASLIYCRPDSTGAVISGPPSFPLIAVGGGGELIVGLSKEGVAPVVDIPEIQIATYYYQVPACILVIRRSIAYEYAYAGARGTGFFIPIVMSPDGKGCRWLSYAHYVITRMIDQSGDSICFDHGVSLLGNATQMTTANGFDFTASWIHDGANTGVSVSVSCQGGISIASQPGVGGCPVASGSQIGIGYKGFPNLSSFVIKCYVPSGIGVTTTNSISQFQQHAMPIDWDFGRSGFLPVLIDNLQTQDQMQLSYTASSLTDDTGTVMGGWPLLHQVSWANGRVVTLGWTSYPFRSNAYGFTPEYSDNIQKQHCRVWGVNRIDDTDSVLGVTRTTLHDRVVPIPDSTSNAWLSTSFYDSVTYPDGSAKTFYYVEPVQGAGPSIQTLAHLQHQIREIREYPTGGGSSDANIPDATSSASRIIVFDRFDLRRLGSPDGDINLMGSTIYPTRTRSWDAESRVLKVDELTNWDPSNFDWGSDSLQYFVATGIPDLSPSFAGSAYGSSLPLSYSGLQYSKVVVKNYIFDQSDWIGPLNANEQTTVQSDLSPGFSGVQTPLPFSTPPVVRLFEPGSELIHSQTVGAADCQTVTTYTHPVGSGGQLLEDPSDVLVSGSAGQSSPNSMGEHYGYDPLGFPSSIQPKGIGWSLGQETDPLGRLVSQTDANGVVTAYSYDSAGRIAAVQVGSDIPTVISYDDSTYRIMTSTQGAKTSEFHYDAFGELIAVKRFDTRGIASCKIIGRDAMGRIAGETLWLPLTVGGHSVTDADAFTPNLLSSLTTTTPAMTFCSSRDKLGNCLIWSHYPAKTVVHPALYVGTQTFYDGRGRVVKVIAPDGGETDTIYGAGASGSQVTRIVNGAQVWDASALSSSAVALSTTFGYDSLDHLICVVDAAGQATKYSYDAMDRLASVVQSSPSSGSSQARSWSYDPLGRLSRMTQPESGTTSFSNFTIGGKASNAIFGDGSASPKNVYTAFDSIERPLRVWSSDGSVDESYNYDETGHGHGNCKLTSASTNGAKRSLIFEGANGELSSLVRTIDGLPPFTIALTYNGYGDLYSRTYPDGKVETITYDASKDLPSGAFLDGAALASFSYDDPAWLMTGLSYNSNNGSTVYGYVNERLASITHFTPGQTLAGWAFTYDLTGNLLGDGEDCYGYDALGRLTAAYIEDPEDPVSGHGLYQAFTYDAFGNRVAMSTRRVSNWTNTTAPPSAPSFASLGNDPRALPSYVMSAQEIERLGSMNRLPSTIGGLPTGASYDAQGNLVSIFTRLNDPSSQVTASYDAVGRISSIGFGSVLALESQGYSYDDEGLRFKVTDSKTGLVKYNLYDEGRRLIAQYEVPSGGSLIWKKDLLYVGNREIAEVDASHTWVEFLDHLGSPRFEWDGTATSSVDGVHLIAQKYAPFGEYLNDPTTQSKFEKGFTNHEQTDPSGLIYMQARFYAPMYGRFLSPDPARDQHFEQTQSWNIYSYVQNDPTMRVDPTGMFGPPSGQQDFIRQMKKMGKSDAEIQGALKTFHKGQGLGVAMGAVLAAGPLAAEFGGPLLRVAVMLSSAEAPQAIQKGQEMLQEAQQAAPEVQQAVQKGPDAMQAAMKAADVRGVVESAGMNLKQAGQFFGWGKDEATGKTFVGAIQNFSKAGLEKAGWTLEKIQSLGKAYQQVATANSNNPSAAMRAKQMQELAKLFEKK